MTAASKVTLTRIFLIPVYMVLMYVSGGVAGPWMWGALGVFILASVTDFVDGYIARHCNQVSDFGKFLQWLCFANGAFGLHGRLWRSLPGSLP